MNKLFLKGALLFSFVFGMVVYSSAQTVTPQEVGVTALLGNFLRAEKVSDVHFGGIVIPTTTSQVTMLKTTGNVEVTGGSATTFFSQDLIKKGQIKIWTNIDTAFDIKFGSTLSLNGSDGGTLLYTPEVWANDNNANIPSGGVGTINVTPTQQANGYLVNIGGKLDFLGTEKNGTYTGTLTLNISWQ